MYDKIPSRREQELHNLQILPYAKRGFINPKIIARRRNIPLNRPNTIKNQASWLKPQILWQSDEVCIQVQNRYFETI